MSIKYPKHNDRKLLIIMIALAVTLLIDISFVKINDLVDIVSITMQSKVILFSITSSFCLLFQFLLIKFVMNSLAIPRLTKTAKVRTFYMISIMSFFALTFLVTFLAFQQFYHQYYDTWIITLIVSISYGTSTVLIIWLALLFFYWYKSSGDLIVLLYFISMVLIAFHLIFTGLFIDAKLSDTQPRVGEFVGGGGDVSGGSHLFLAKSYKISSFISFFSIWMTTAILMNSYREKLIRSVTFWTILVLPLGYFAVTFFFEYFGSDILDSYFHSDPVLVSIILTAFLSFGKPIGGLIFAIAFWNMSKLIGYERNMKISLFIAGWGIFFIFSANQADTQIVSPYPPFGIATVTIMNVASYLLVLGIFNSATLVSANNSLRIAIHNHALKLLNPIGRAEMEREIQRAVRKISQDEAIAEISNDESFDFDENELKNYLKEVINLKKANASK